MVKSLMKRAQTTKKSVKKPDVVPADVSSKTQPDTRQTAANSSSIDSLKDNLKRIDKGRMVDALKRVKEMKSDSWKDPGTVRKLTENIAQDIGIKIDPRRMDAFMNAFGDIAKNAGDKGPNVSVDEIAKKYAGTNVDDKTIKEIKKFVK